ncbi:hypothetical protein ACLESD_08885 [Pyxidicoccus sp. 3LFB2]
MDRQRSCEGGAWETILLPRGILIAVALGGTVLIPHRVHAQDEVGLQDYIDAARGLYEDLDYERALERLAHARQFSTGPEDDALLSLYQGVILADFGKQNEARAAFEAALLVQPEAALPVKVSPKVTEQFENIRVQVKSELKARGRAAEVVPFAPIEPARAPSAEVKLPEEARPGPGVTTQVAKSGGMRSHAWLPATLGGALLVGGGVSYALAHGEQSRLRRDDASLATLQDVQRTGSRGRTLQAVGVGLASAGVVGLGISAGMLLLGRPAEQARVELGVSTDGASAFVSGRWP